MSIILILLSDLILSIHWRSASSQFTDTRHGVPYLVHSSRHLTRTRFLHRIESLGPEKLDLIRSGRLVAAATLPFGFDLVDGKVMEVTNKLVQKTTRNGTTGYFIYTDQEQVWPVYERTENEETFQFVLFQDPFYWRGSGHLILLRKVFGINPKNVPNVGKYNQLYDAYMISLRSTILPQVDLLDYDFFLDQQRKKEWIEDIKMIRNETYKSYENPKENPGHLELREGKDPSKRKRNRRGLGIRGKKIHLHMNSRKGTECFIEPLNVTRVLQRSLFEAAELIKIVDAMKARQNARGSDAMGRNDTNDMLKSATPANH